MALCDSSSGDSSECDETSTAHIPFVEAFQSAKYLRGVAGRQLFLIVFLVDGCFFSG